MGLLSGALFRKYLRSKRKTKDMRLKMKHVVLKTSMLRYTRHVVPYLDCGSALLLNLHLASLSGSEDL